jgi:hypothetical protein
VEFTPCCPMLGCSVLALVLLKTPLMSVHLKERKLAHVRDTYTLMFITALFTTTKLWDQPRYPSTDEQLKQMWYISSVEYYPAIQNKIMSFTGK